MNLIFASEKLESNAKRPTSSESLSAPKTSQKFDKLERNELRFWQRDQRRQRATRQSDLLLRESGVFLQGLEIKVMHAEMTFKRERSS